MLAVAGQARCDGGGSRRRVVAVLTAVGLSCSGTSAGGRSNKNPPYRRAHVPALGKETEAVMSSSSLLLPLLLSLSLLMLLLSLAQEQASRTTRGGL